MCLKGYFGVELKVIFTGKPLKMTVFLNVIRYETLKADKDTTFFENDVKNYKLLCQN